MPSARISDAASNTRMRRATPEACSAKASTEPPIPPPMTIASMGFLVARRPAMVTKAAGPRTICLKGHRRKHIGGRNIGVKYPGGCRMPKPHETLEKVALFRSLEGKAREGFEHRCQWRHAHPKEWLLEQNDIGTDIYFLTSGVVRVLITPSPDREIILGDIEAGGYFGEMAAIDGQPRSAGILAITDATIARMPATVFREIIHQYPDVSEQLLRQLVTRIRTLDQRVNEFSSMHVKNRIYAELLRRSRPDPTDKRKARGVAAAGAFRYCGAGEHPAGDGGARAESAGAGGAVDQASGRLCSEQRAPSSCTCWKKKTDAEVCRVGSAPRQEPPRRRTLLHRVNGNFGQLGRAGVGKQ